MMNDDIPRTVDRHVMFVWSQSVFETEADRRVWWHRSHPLLDKNTPWSASNSPEGAAKVRDLLVALKHGGLV